MVGEDGGESGSGKRNQVGLHHMDSLGLEVGALEGFGLPSISDGQISPPRKELGNLGPLASDILMGLDQDLVLLCAPGAAIDCWVQYAEPSGAAL